MVRNSFSVYLTTNVQMKHQKKSTYIVAPPYCTLLRTKKQAPDQQNVYDVDDEVMKLTERHVIKKYLIQQLDVSYVYVDNKYTQYRQNRLKIHTEKYTRRLFTLIRYV